MANLSAYEQWMVQSNLDRIAGGENAVAVVAVLRANGYARIADAVTAATTTTARDDLVDQ